MFSKHILSYGTCYIRTVIPCFKRKCAYLEISNFTYNSKDESSFNKSYCSDSGHSSSKIWSPENVNETINSNGSSRKQAPENVIKATNSNDKIRLGKWIEMVRYEGANVPENITEELLIELCAMPNETQRLKFLEYLFKKQIAQKKDLDRKEKIKLLKSEKRMERDTRAKEHIEYGLWRNTMFSKSSKSHFSSLLNNRLLNAMKFGQPLVIDMSFYDHMSKREVKSFAKQLQLSITQNKLKIEPFDLTLCNVDFKHQEFKVFTEKYMPNILKPSYPMNVTSKSYLDMFPKEKIVYLTPNARTEMETYDHDAVYVIGGLVDLGAQYPLTLAKAKKENIQAMKLPIDKYHIFKGHKSLAVHVMIQIMLDLQEDGDFKKAFKNIPRRLIKTGDESHLDAYDYAKRRPF